MFPTVFKKVNNVGLKSAGPVRMVWQALRVAKVLDHDGLVIVTGTFRSYRDMRLLVPTTVACQEVGRHFGHLAATSVLATDLM
jgi:hypothetical protein